VDALAVLHGAGSFIDPQQTPGRDRKAGLFEDFWFRASRKRLPGALSSTGRKCLSLPSHRFHVSRT
jgi:hypothetical protein